MFLKSVQTWASAGVGQAAKPTLTKPIKPEEYDKNALKRPQGVKAVVSRPPKRFQSSTPGHIEYGAKPTLTKPIMSNQYDKNTLKRPYGRKTPIPTPYTRENAMKQFKKSTSETKEEPEKPEATRQEMLQQLIKSTQDPDLVRKYTVLLNFIQRMDIIMQKRELTVQEQKRLNGANSLIDEAFENFNPEENPLLQAIVRGEEKAEPALGSAVGAQDAATRAQASAARAQQLADIVQQASMRAREATQAKQAPAEQDILDEAYEQLVYEYPDFDSWPEKQQKATLQQAIKQIEERRRKNDEYDEYLKQKESELDQIQQDIEDEQRRAVERYVKANPDFKTISKEEKDRIIKELKTEAKNRVLAWYEKEAEKQKRQALEGKYDQPKEPIEPEAEEDEGEVDEGDELERMEKGIASSAPVRITMDTSIKPLAKGKPIDYDVEGDEGDEGESKEPAEAPEEEQEEPEPEEEEIKQLTPLLAKNKLDASNENNYDSLMSLNDPDKYKLFTEGAPPAYHNPANNTSPFEQKVDQILAKYPSKLTVKKIIPNKKDYEDVKNSQKQIIEKVFNYLTSVEIPIIKEKRKQMVLDLMYNLPDVERTKQNIIYLKQNKAEFNQKERWIKNPIVPPSSSLQINTPIMTEKVWIDKVTKKSQISPFQLGLRDIQDIIINLVQEGKTKNKDTMAMGKISGEKIEDYLKRMFKLYPEFKELALAGQITRANFGLITGRNAKVSKNIKT